MGYRKVRGLEQIFYIFERFNRQRWEWIFGGDKKHEKR